MNHITELHDYSDELYRAEAKGHIDPEREKAIKDQIAELVDGEFDRLEDRCGEFISDVAARRAARFLESVLNGDEDAMRRLIGADRSHDGRRDFHDKPWAKVIHGRLFEGSTIELRRKIVEAHADLIRDERIADLESVVEGLTAQIRRYEELVDRTRGCA